MTTTLFFTVALVIMLVICGLFLLLPTAISRSSANKLHKKCTQRVTAHVTQFQHERSGSELSFRPIFKFKALDGKTYQVVSPYNSRDGRYDKHERVELYYDPQRPTRFYVPQDEQLSTRSLKLMLISGICCIALAIVLAVIFRFTFWS